MSPRRSLRPVFARCPGDYEVGAAQSGAPSSLLPWRTAKCRKKLSLTLHDNYEPSNEAGRQIEVVTTSVDLWSTTFALVAKFFIDILKNKTIKIVYILPSFEYQGSINVFIQLFLIYSGFSLMCSLRKSWEE